MSEDIGLSNSDSLQNAGKSLGDEASQLHGNAQALFSTMETDVRSAMDGGAPNSFMEAHGALNRSFDSMMGWLERMGINLSDVNVDILQADEDNMSDFNTSGGKLDGLPPINA